MNEDYASQVAIFITAALCDKIKHCDVISKVFHHPDSIRVEFVAEETYGLYLNINDDYIESELDDGRNRYIISISDPDMIDKVIQYLKSYARCDI